MNRYTPITCQKIEKRFTIPCELFNTVDFSEMGICQTDENLSLLPHFIIGEKYALKTPGCDGFKGNEKIYKLIAIDDEFGGVKIDSIVVKQIAGESGNIYTLSKNDCSNLGIEYEDGLQLFPKKLPWIHVKEKEEFDEHNLATTPKSNIDNTIRHVVIKLKGFTDYSDGYVLSPSGMLIKEEQFEKSVIVENKEPIVYGNGLIVKEHTKLDARIVHPDKCMFNHGNFISSENEVFIYIRLKVYDKSWPSFDNWFGVDPKYFYGINPNEFFIITWDEIGAITIEEYKDMKERKAKENAEKVRQYEERMKRNARNTENIREDIKYLDPLARINENVRGDIKYLDTLNERINDIRLYVDVMSKCLKVSSNKLRI